MTETPTERTDRRVLLNIRVHPTSLATIDDLARTYHLSRSQVARTMLGVADRAAVRRQLEKLRNER